MPSTDLGSALLQTARHALAQAFRRAGGTAPGAHAALGALGATFVTLTQAGELRGCIGTLEAHRPLRHDVEQNALSAAFHDPRFAPLAADEYEITRIEVSLLTAPVPLPVADEDDLLRKLRPGVDGIVLAWRGRRATFLPQVWDTLAEPRDFVAALKQKAGLGARFWADDLSVSRYAVDKFREPEPHRLAVHQS
jgi:AmmeMemoRadiSam system protein A